MGRTSLVPVMWQPDACIDLHSGGRVILEGETRVVCKGQCLATVVARENARGRVPSWCTLPRLCDLMSEMSELTDYFHFLGIFYRKCSTSFIHQGET